MDIAFFYLISRFSKASVLKELYFFLKYVHCCQKFGVYSSVEWFPGPLFYPIDLYVCFWPRPCCLCHYGSVIQLEVMYDTFKHWSLNKFLSYACYSLTYLFAVNIKFSISLSKYSCLLNLIVSLKWEWSILRFLSCVFNMLITYKKYLWKESLHESSKLKF